MLVEEDELELSCPTRTEPWPAEVDLILSAMETVAAPIVNRRAMARHRFRVRADLRLFADGPGGAQWTLYTRDVNARELGFITPHRLPLGYGGIIELPTPQGRKISVHCTLLRCRQASHGWFEGALYFNREQWIFMPRTD